MKPSWVPGLQGDGFAARAVDLYLRPKGVSNDLKLKDIIKRDHTLTGFAVGYDDLVLINVVTSGRQEPLSTCQERAQEKQGKSVYYPGISVSSANKEGKNYQEPTYVSNGARHDG